MQRITASVGKEGVNRNSDVKVIQTLLNQKFNVPGQAALKVDGLIGAKTIARIEAYQKSVVKMVRPDGRVDPNGKTFTSLTQGGSAPGAPAPVAPPAPVATGPAQAGNLSMSTRGKEFLKGIEALRLQPYDDQTGKQISAWNVHATIGYGHLISQGEWNTYRNGITQTQADSLFMRDLAPFETAVNSAVTVPMTANQFDALILLAFNIGRAQAGFAGSSVVKMINNPNAKTSYPTLEAAWKAWNKSAGKVNQGLINRRAAEWKIYTQGIYQGW